MLTTAIIAILSRVRFVTDSSGVTVDTRNRRFAVDSNGTATKIY